MATVSLKSKSIVNVFACDFSLQSAYIWLPPDKQGEFDVEIGARVVDVNQTQLKVVDDNGKVFNLKKNFISESY